MWSMFCLGGGRWWNLSWDQPFWTAGVVFWKTSRDFKQEQKNIPLSEEKKGGSEDGEQEYKLSCPKWYGEELHFIIHLFIHPSSLFLLSFILGSEQSYFTPSSELLFILLYRNSYPQLFIIDSNIGCKHKDLYARIGGIKRYKRKESVTPYCPVSWCQHSISSIKSNRVTFWVLSSGWQHSECGPGGSWERLKICNPEMQLPVGARNSLKTNSSFPPKMEEVKPSTWVTHGLCQIIYILHIVSTGYMVAIKI